MSVVMGRRCDIFPPWCPCPCPRSRASPVKERKKTDNPNEGWEEDRSPPLHEQDLGRTIRDTGERERGAHRDTEGGWAGSQGFLSRIGQVAPGGTGAGAGLLLVALS